MGLAKIRSSRVRFGRQGWGRAHPSALAAKRSRGCVGCLWQRLQRAQLPAAGYQGEGLRCAVAGVYPAGQGGFVADS